MENHKKNPERNPLTGDHGFNTEFWRERYHQSEYYNDSVEFPRIAPAYQYGMKIRTSHEDKEFDEVEEEIKKDWESFQDEHGLSWERARVAIKDAWHWLLYKDPSQPPLGT